LAHRLARGRFRASTKRGIEKEKLRRHGREEGPEDSAVSGMRAKGSGEVDDEH